MYCNHTRIFLTNAIHYSIKNIESNEGRGNMMYYNIHVKFPKCRTF